jgi:hypothetical protein
LTQIKPLPRADSVRVKKLIQEVIADNPADYLPADGWQDKASKVLEEMLPAALSKLLDEFLAVRLENQNTKVTRPPSQVDDRRLGF